MPDYRRLHNAFDMGERTDQLTDFELRVWLLYRACADDFGVCPCLPGLLKGKSRRLAKIKDDKIVTRAMGRLVAVGLCVGFDHQGLSYLCQTDWQDFEDIRYPRRSKHPFPTAEIFKQLSQKTQNLFREFRDIPKTFQSNLTPPARGRAGNPHPNPNPNQNSGRGSGGNPPARRRGNGSATPAKHALHEPEFCDWVCFPSELATEFAQRVTGVPVDEARAQVLAWAAAIRQSWHGRIVPDGSVWDFWKHRWTETHGGSKPTASAGVDPLAGLHALEKAGFHG